MLGGLLSGLKGGLGKFGAGGGGLLGGAHDMLMGTTPELAVQDRVLAPVGERDHELRQMPNIQATGKMTGGLLDRMKEPDARGLTFADKLFASGSILQGDSGGAASYVANQRAAADALGQRDKQEKLAQQGLEALRGAVDPVTGQLDYRKYLAALPAGADPSAGLKVREGLMPDITPISGARGAINLFDRAKGAFVPGGIAGEAPQQELFNPDGSINQRYIAGRRADAEATAGGRRAGAPPVGRAGGGGGGRGGGKGRKAIPPPGDGFVVVGRGG